MAETKRTFSERKNTTQFQLTIRFIGLLVSAVLLLSLAIMGITIAELYESTKEQTVLVEESLKGGQQKTLDGWENTLAGSVAKDNSPYLIRVGLGSGEVLFSSDDAAELYDEFSTLKQFILLDRVLWTSELEPYYYTSFQTGKTKVTILVDMEDQFEVIGRIFSFTIFLTFIVIIIGSLVTYRFSRKISGALVYMNQEISQLESSSAEQQLTVPKTPLEVQNIAKSFNLLLMKQRASLKREQQFVTDASHELRTPLAAIRGHVNLIKRRGKTHPQVIPTSLEYIDKESKRMEILVEQLLTLGRLEKQLETETIDLSMLINQTINELKVVMPQRLTVQIEEKIVIKGRSEHFYQITRNLLENAMKYTDDTGTISIKLFSKEQGIYLLIEDSGIGISNEEKSKVFERFYRVDRSRSSEIPGTGIGLAIVKELVELYQGNIMVSDVTPKGTRFTLIFPMVNP
ncbi:sensor histidine kinase [Enterococcus crotali]|uniref:sensor histidine kinase n=1 Tax=Enterococcus crotali TaxID=1453587 RepID=UPI000470895C|nr:HAMP domain-containing sensor histidine kinase [Enterococcus crotali]